MDFKDVVTYIRNMPPYHSDFRVLRELVNTLHEKYELEPRKSEAEGAINAIMREHGSEFNLKALIEARFNKDGYINARKNMVARSTTTYLSNFIDCIKQLRSAKGCSLVEAKRMVEQECVAYAAKVWADYVASQK